MTPKARMPLLSEGTTANEALHAELGNWFAHSRLLHQSTMELKLRVFQLYKLMAHFVSMRRPTTRQMAPKRVVAAAAMKPLFTPKAWKQWCDELGRDGVGQQKADLPLLSKRTQQSSIVRQALKKKPAKKVVSLKKRTAFTLKRVSGLVTAGRRREE